MIRARVVALTLLAGVATCRDGTSPFDPNQPVARFTVHCFAPVTPLNCVYDARVSFAAVPIVSYVWSFGDGQGWDHPDAVYVHGYARAGRYRVTLAVIDATGRRSDTGRTIRVGN